MTVIVDYGMGNVGSIVNMLKKLGSSCLVAASEADINEAERLILPGVGAFDAGMRNLRLRNYEEILSRKVHQEYVPILGICLGMQLFSRSSEEGVEPGLGWLDATTVRFRPSSEDESLKVPHMGWNDVRVCRPSPLFPDPDAECRFYFVHSYHVHCRDLRNVLTTTVYGQEFTSTVCHANILGTQFHPEKSHRFGLELFQRFLEWQPGSSTTNP